MNPLHPGSTALPPLCLRGIGALHAGGARLTVQGQPAQTHTLAAGGTPITLDPNGEYLAGQMYAQYFLPAQPRSTTPLQLWHGGGLTGACWETTPDGRPGWLQHCLAAAWDVYLCDAAERGRSGFAPVPHVWPAPLSQTLRDVFHRFRFGAAPAGTPLEQLAGYAYPGQQFPVEALGQFVRQLVPRWSHTDDIITDAYGALLAQTGPSAIICHSQGGMFGLSMALRHPERVRAVVALEPAAVPLALLQQHRLQVPVLIVLGDHMARDARWPRMRQQILDFAAASGSAEVMELPSIGIQGNSHMLMMDRNSAEIAALVLDWLEQKVPADSTTPQALVRA